MTFKELNNFFKKEISLLYSDNEIQSIYNIIIEEKLNLNKAQVYIKNNEKVPKIGYFINVLDKLKKGIPIQYIIGKVYFLNTILKTNQNVLIPRPETEELVNWVLSSEKKNKKIKVLDIGTGSGCISIALKKNRSEWDVHAYEKSTNAIKIAIFNSKINKTLINFKKFDILKDKSDNVFDIIVSNPPYVPENQKKNTSKIILEFEPNEAIFVPNNKSLIFYNAIVNFSKKSLRKGGKLYFEFYSENLIKIKHILQKNKFHNIEVKRDLNEKNRFISAIKK